MAKKIAIKKDKTLTQEEVLKLLVGITERPVRCPKSSKKAKKRKKTDSGKKKKRAQKTE